jgi:hypothetical protein
MKNKAGSIPVTQILLTTLRGVGFEEKDFRDLNKYVWENLTLGDQPWSFERMRTEGFVTNSPEGEENLYQIMKKHEKDEERWAAREFDLQNEADRERRRSAAIYELYRDVLSQLEGLKEGIKGKELNEKRSTSETVCGSPPAEPEDVGGI